ASDLCSLSSVQRPVIKEEQHDWRRHQHWLRHQSAGKQDREREITGERGRTCIADVSSESQKEKDRAQNIFAFRNPGNRFNPQRMNREKRGNKNAVPKPTGDVAQPKEKRNHGDRVQENICEMVAAGFEIVELAIDYVRNERERVPI